MLALNRLLTVMIYLVALVGKSAADEIEFIESCS